MLMSSIGMALAHMLRVDLAVAIVSMVNTTSSSDHNESVAVCGGEEDDKDIFGVESRAIAPTLRVPVFYSHHHPSMIINGSVACTFVALVPFAAPLSFKHQHEHYQTKEGQTLLFEAKGSSVGGSHYHHATSARADTLVFAHGGSPLKIVFSEVANRDRLCRVQLDD